MCFSSHSAACGVIASAVNLTAISWIWRWSSVRSNWLISQRALACDFGLGQPFGLEHNPNRRPLAHRPGEGDQARPAVEVDAVHRGPAGDDEQIGVGNGQLVAH